MRGKNRSGVYTATRSLPNARLNHPDSNTCEQSVHTFSCCLWCVWVSSSSGNSPGCIWWRRQDILSHNGKIIIKKVQLSKIGRKGDGSVLGYFHLQRLEHNAYFFCGGGARDNIKWHNQLIWSLTLPLYQQTHKLLFFSKYAASDWLSRGRGGVCGCVLSMCIQWLGLCRRGWEEFVMWAFGVSRGSFSFPLG